MKPNHIAHIYLDDGGWTWVYIKKVDHRNFIHFVRLAQRATTERMTASMFSQRAELETIQPATEKQNELWKSTTSAWAEASILPVVQNDQGKNVDIVEREPGRLYGKVKCSCGLMVTTNAMGRSAHLKSKKHAELTKTP